ncbi:S8 family serine peptidase [Shewanella sp. GutDb-MelDb]|uniref:S8 family serine peptidase n=1 Tax=Shewanella sp. GutDb-MelDb TaxID=2058316 RepID=UPI000C7BD360|nr:S8 family serine peptidase [Shewanella sp. GutDb-MelDb]PKG55347.1 alkaline serine protease [Shewanella sp. GutDb-MelDb]
MKLTKIAATLIALSVGASAAVTAGERYVIQVDNSKKGVVKALAKKMGGELNLDGNGFIAATFSGKDLAQVKGLLNNPHIKLVEVDQRRSLMSFSDSVGNPMTEQITPYAIDQSNVNDIAFDASASTNKKVCIIDSGLDRSNNDFDWNNIDGDSDSGTGSWDENGGPHGTHVAGTIGAADNGFGVVGMAPGIEMHIIKVFNADGWGYSSDLAHAANVCSAAGADIISMSLGGGGSNSTESNAFQSFTDAGGLVVAAAGNDGNSVRSYPAGYPSVMMVGANDANNDIADFSQFPTCTTGRGKKQKTDTSICVEIAAGGVDTLSTYPAGMATASNMTVDGTAYSSSAMENAGSIDGSVFFMDTAEATDGGANGMVCMIDRGVISFHDKVLNCENSGGIGAIIINNEPGMLYGTLGDTNATTIPAVGAAFEDRAVLIAASTADIAIGSSDYGFMSGTSMATPAVSGIAARVWSNHSECTGTEIRAALNASAMDSGANGHDVYFGHGIIDAAAADTYLTANGCAGGDNGGGGDPGTGDGLSVTETHYKQRGIKYVDLSFSGAAGNTVDIFRDGNSIGTSVSSATYTDTISSKGGGTYIYKACDTGTSTCSVDVSVTF